MRIHILRAESVTPIAIDLERRRIDPDSYERQLGFATILLYREREYPEGPPYEGEAAAFFWLLHAADELSSSP